MFEWLFLLLFGFGFHSPLPSQPVARAPAPPTQLNRVAVAVEGAESSYGVDRSMWRANLAGPQGPMQVSAAAAADVGGGNRFLSDENRAIGRAYLARLFAHYGNWTDAVAAYNQGPGSVDQWISHGRPDNPLAAKLKIYLDRIRQNLLFFSTAGRTVAPNAAPPVVEIHDAKLRKKYLSDRAAIAQLLQFRDVPPASESEADTAAVLKTIRVVAARPGYGEFTRGRSPTAESRPSEGALNEIAGVLATKLEAECDAIVLIDRRQSRRQP